MLIFKSFKHFQETQIYKFSANIVVTAVTFILLLSCARQGFPPGGPVDKTPPSIVYTIPATDSLNVPVDTFVEIGFSEAVEPYSAEASLFITPYPGDNVEKKWKKDRLKILFQDSLLDNRTYVITVGTGTKDLRNNAMKESFSLAFSTGAVLDKGEISGCVFGDDKIKGTQIWAYDLLETPEPNPVEVKPLYITQAGDDGKFQFIHLAEGKYRLFAVNDRDMNKRYTPQYDMLGVTFKDISLTADANSAENIVFKVSLRDTLPPFIYSAYALDNHHFSLRYSEKMVSDSLDRVDNYTFLSETGDTLEIADVFQDYRNAGVWHFTMRDSLLDEKYTIRVKHAYDMAFHTMHQDSSLKTFTGTSKPDTTGPQYIAMVPSDSSSLIYPDSSFQFYFSEPLDKNLIENSIICADTLGDTLSAKITWINGAGFVFDPDSLKPKTYYQITIPVDSVKDIFGNVTSDTLFLKRFTTLDPDTLTEISGKISDADTSASGPFYMQVVSTTSNKYNIVLVKDGDYRFNNILPGIYTINYFRDENKDGKYNWGNAFPFSPAERFWFNADSIKVRSRWPNEENDLVLPK